MRTFVIGDTHFNHKNIIKYCSRPYEDVEDMNYSLIDSWNNTVKDDDLVIHVGDIALASKTQTKEFVQQLRGRKWLVMGNHDNFSVQDYYDMGFEYVSQFPIVYKDFIIISHKPMFITENMPYFNIYGHVHDNPMYKDRTENSWCVSVERINYAPALLDDSIFNSDILTSDSARYERQRNYEDGRYPIGFYRGKEVEIILSDGRIFVEVGTGDNKFRQEYTTTKVIMGDIIDKIKYIFTDEQHPFTQAVIKKLS